MYTLVPLGNPGNEYTTTRHNAARIVSSSFKEEDIPCEVFIPDTYMNESGKAVAEYLRYHNDREIIVMYDDKDLPLGSIRISYDKSDGGHNGVKSIIESLGTKEFVRVRIGIAPMDEEGKTKAPHGEEVQKFVMGRFTEHEMEELKKITPRILDAIKDIVSLGHVKAMEKYN